MWCLIWNRLPTKDNVGKRIELENVDKICAWCGVALETAEHTFLVCEEVPRLWNYLIEWIGITWTAPKNVEQHLLNFSDLLGGRRWRKRLGGLWVCTIWVIWKWRNERLFANKPWDMNRILEEIKCRFWSWCAVRGEIEPALIIVSGQIIIL